MVDSSLRREAGLPFHAYRVRVDAEHLQLAVPRGPAGSLVAESYGIGAIRVTWPPIGVEDDFVACKDITWEWTYTGLHGRVVGTPVADAAVFGCSNGSIEVEPDGTFYADIPTKPCELYLVAHEDGLWARSPPVPLSPRPGEDLEVTLHYPSDGDWRPWTGAELEEAREKQESATSLCAQIRKGISPEEEPELWGYYVDLCVEHFGRMKARLEAAEAAAR